MDTIRAREPRTAYIAYASLAQARKTSVLLLSDGNIFLEKALGLDANVDLVRASPRAALPRGDFDVIVCDAEAPKNLPAANLLLFACTPPAAPVEPNKGFLATPGVADWNRKHPVTSGSSWADMRIAESLNSQVKPWAQTLVEAERGPLVVAGERGGKRSIWVGFDVRASDLPLRVTFPIFVTNSLRWLGGTRGSNSAASWRTGESVSLGVPPSAREISIIAPDKSTRRVPVDGTSARYDGANEAGLYQASAKDWKTSFGVSLLNAAESDLTPRGSLTVGGEKVTGTSRARSNRELWPWVVALALLLLAGEWWVFHRGA